MKKKPILCLDFDGVIHSYTSGWKGATNIPDPPVPGAFKFIQKRLEEGWDVVIHSSRARHLFGILAMKSWLRKWSKPILGWYSSPFCHDGLEEVRFARFKPSALVTIDDRALQFRGNWPSSDELKYFRSWNK